MAYTNVLEHPPECSSISTGNKCVGSEYSAFGPANRPMALKHQGYGNFGRTPRVSPNLRPATKAHQGMIFLRPFFFLLVDSFLLSPLLPFCVPSGAVEPSAFAPSV